ncbi:MAG: GNAT family N-acetyltransferase [Deltaproteobacteria bacterium]|nr:GNAT family N-acetyltransferase [Deltaproteobacteria bacterium]
MHIRPATMADLDALIELEHESYPEDEAASREVFAHRLEHAGDCFTVGESGGQPVGLVCGTRARGIELEARSMREHVADGQTLCIHSVVVAPPLRRRGLGHQLLDDYRERARRLDGVRRLALICKQHLVELYRRAGFELVGPSKVQHGRDPWLEMRQEL